MTDERTPIRSHDDEERDVARLLALAGPRTRPPADVEMRIRAATMAAFDALPEPTEETAAGPAAGPSRTVRRVTWAAAAAVLVSLVAGWLALRSPAPIAGEILFATGGYTVRGSDEKSEGLAPGSIVRTSREGRLLVGLGAGRQLRVDQGTSLTLRSDSEIWLHGGRIYLDAAGGRGLVVVTPNATITDVGTQFQVMVSGARLDVATREGAVSVVLGERRIVSRAVPGTGEALAIDGLTLVKTSAVPTTGDRWAWTQASRPLFSVAGRSVRDYLEWAARESGRELVFESRVSAQQADLRRLGGSASVDADLESVARVLAATAFHLGRGEAHQLVVGLESGDD